VVEILSPGDDTDNKLPFYAAHGVDELLIIDPDTQTISWLGQEAASVRPVLGG